MLASTGRGDCPGVRQSVQVEVESEPLTLQIGGATVRRLNIAVLAGTVSYVHSRLGYGGGMPSETRAPTSGLPRRRAVADRPALGGAARRRARGARHRPAPRPARRDVRGCWRRATSTLEDVPDFLEPTLRKFLPDPSHLKDMDAAVARLVRAVQQGERIVVFGDYDVDGATSSALLLRFFRAVGGNIGVYIPDRRKEGYGPNAPALLKLREEGAAVVVTVDCGVTAYEPLAEARKRRPRPDRDRSSPGRDRAARGASRSSIPTGSTTHSPHKQLAAVGVAFLLRRRRQPRAARGRLVRRRRGPSPTCGSGSTSWRWARCADVVPLTGVNRALVRQGLLVMAAARAMPGWRRWPTSRACSETPGAYHLGFMLGPRVNAGGRVGQADLGARLLSSDDAHEVGALALRLDEFNAERRAIEREVLDQAIARIEGLYGPDRKGLPAALVVESEGWHVGVIGIVASRLVERYGRPTFVIGMDGELGKGSGRSVRGVDLGAAVLAARQSGPAGERRRPRHGGGPHGGARARCPISRSSSTSGSRRSSAPRRAVRELGIDAALAPGAATQELVGMIERAGPFGAGNALPRFALTSVRVNYAQPVGEGHVRCTLVGAERGRVEAIAFRAGQSGARTRAARSGPADPACRRRAAASTATTAAKPCACRSTTPPRPRARSCADSACLISAGRSP